MTFEKRFIVRFLKLLYNSIFGHHKRLLFAGPLMSTGRRFDVSRTSYTAYVWRDDKERQEWAIWQMTRRPGGADEQNLATMPTIYPIQSIKRCTDMLCAVCYL